MTYSISKDFHNYPALSELEARASQKYLEAGYDYTQWQVTPLSLFKSFAEQGQLWVCTTRKGAAAGFAMIAPIWTNLHLYEIDTDPPHMGRGVATMLLRAIIDWAKAGDYGAITLRTFRTTPWSVKLYQKFNFQFTEDAKVEGDIGRYLQMEKGLGAAAKDRCTMILNLKPQSRGCLKSHP